MSTLLEQTRAAHEDIERLERAIVADYHTEAKGHKERLAQGHRVRAMLDRLQEQAAKLVAIYEDADGVRKEEIAALRGDNMFSAFYERLSELKDFHARFPDLEITLGEGDDGGPGAAAAPPQRVEFSGEEAGGRCLDLHAHYLEFVNSKRFGRQCDYAEYVAGLAGFARVPRGARLTKAWRDYLGRLLEYLESFYDRTQPLSQLSKVYAGLDLATFSARFDAGQVDGWLDRGLGGGELAGTPVGGQAALPPAAQLDLDAFESPQELEAVGPDKLREALAALGLKSGGTPAQRAERLYLTKHTPLDQLDRKHFAKGAGPMGAAPPPADPARAVAAARATAELEAKVGALAGALATALADTVAAVEKKQARTYEEILADAEEVEEADVVSDEDEEDEYVYNPLRLPLGWDGKPIPYWLYKLHGLNIEFKCEICGNESYWGRREYERHFNDARHLTGLRALGVPAAHVKDFYEVTRIDDARALWENLRARRGGTRGTAEEEVEDADGNVYDRKTYEDLKRQGIV